MLLYLLRHSVTPASKSMTHFGFLRTAQYNVNQNHLYFHFTHTADCTSILPLENHCVFSKSNCRGLSSWHTFWGKEPLERGIHLYKRVEFKQGLHMYIAFEYQGNVPQLTQESHSTFILSIALFYYSTLPANLHHCLNSQNNYSYL